MVSPLPSSAPLPRRSDETAFIAAVLARVGAIVRGEARRIRRRPPPRLTFDEMLARLAGSRYTDDKFAHYEQTPAADNASTGRTAPHSRNPDFSTPKPDFSSHVKHDEAARPEDLPAFGRRTDCAALLAVSVDWFDRNVTRLMRDEGFPVPRPGAGQRRWHISLVRDWSRWPRSLKLLARARRAHVRSQRGRR